MGCKVFPGNELLRNLLITCKLPLEAREFLVVCPKTWTVNNVLADVTSRNAKTTELRSLVSLPKMEKLCRWRIRSGTSSAWVAALKFLRRMDKLQMGGLRVIIPHSKRTPTSHRATLAVFHSGGFRNRKGTNSSEARGVGGRRRLHRRRWLAVCVTRQLAGRVMFHLEPGS